MGRADETVEANADLAGLVHCQSGNMKTNNYNNIMHSANITSFRKKEKSFTTKQGMLMLAQLQGMERARVLLEVRLEGIGESSITAHILTMFSASLVIEEKRQESGISFHISYRIGI